MINRYKASFTVQKGAVVLLFLLGILLRLRQYLTGRSLWSDEAMLALNIVDRNVLDLFKPLDYDQGAPLGFLLVEKTANLLFGRNEYSLRLFPLLAGIASIWLFLLLLKRVTNGAGLLTALALFVFNPRLVYYSSEVKQYIIDVVVTIGLLLLSHRLFQDNPTKRDFLWLTLAGFGAIWFSHPAVFVLAGIGLAILIVFLHRREYRHAGYMIGVGFLWMFTIGLMYLLILKDIQQNAYMREYWQGAFFPIPPWSNLDWFGQSINQNIGIQFGIPYAAYFVFGLFFVGWVILWKRDQSFALVIGLIFILTLTASALQLYPVFERMILFLIPLGLILIGKTVEALQQSLPKKYVMNVIGTLLFAGYLLYGPVVTSAGYFIHPKYYEHIRPTMDFLQQSWRPGDGLYVSHGAAQAFEYYAPMYGLQDATYISNAREDYKHPYAILRTLETLRGKPRVWVLMSHVFEDGDFREKDFILDALNQIGDKKREYRVPGTSVYLYLFDLQK